MWFEHPKDEAAHLEIAEEMRLRALENRDAEAALYVGAYNARGHTIERMEQADAWFRKAVEFGGDSWAWEAIDVYVEEDYGKGFREWMIHAIELTFPLPEAPGITVDTNMFPSNNGEPCAVGVGVGFQVFSADPQEAATALTNAAERLMKVDQFGLEDAQIKLSVVASDIFGVSGRDMMNALIRGERDPDALAQMARARMRAKIPQLREAFVGRFNDRHAFLLAKMLARIDTLTADINDLDARIEAEIAPFADAAARLDAIPGVGPVAARVIIAEIGTDMTRFPTASHLAAWARFAPSVKESAGRRKGTGATGHGDRYLAAVLGEAAVSASKTNTFLGERYRRIARRRGKKKAIVAVGRSILIIVWHLLNNPEEQFHDLGPTFYDTRLGTQRAIRNHVQHLQALGYQVDLRPVA